MRREFKDEFWSRGGSGGKGKLVIRVPRLNYRSVPLEVRDRNMHFLGRAMTEKQITLNEGQYVLRVRLPDGSADSTVINVRASDKLKEYRMNWKPKSRFVSQLDIQKQVLKTVKSRLQDRPVHGWFIRFVTFLDGEWKPAPDPPELELADHQIKGGVSATTMLVHGQYPGIYFMEVQKAGGQSVNLAMPVAAYTGALTCHVFIGDDGYSLRVNGALVGSGSAELVSEYMDTGAFQEVTEIMGDAEELLSEKMGNPIEAALGGYALLRLGNLELLHDWPGNLANWFYWLPDGAVIAGELAARRGDHAEAANFLLDALQRGLPIFYEGFSTLLSRIRHYSLYGSKLLPDGRSVEQISAALEQFRKWGHAVDHSALLLTLSGISLVEGEDTLPSRPQPENGWRMFRTTQVSPYDRRDYWTSDF